MAAPGERRRAGPWRHHCCKPAAPWLVPAAALQLHVPQHALCEEQVLQGPLPLQAAASGSFGVSDADPAAAAAAADAPVNFQAAGSRVFVMRRKLIKVRPPG